MSIESSNEPEEFSGFEHSGWEEVSRGYEQHIARLTAQSVDAVLDAAAVGKDSRMLDVCCGPGVLSAAAIVRDAQATGIDFSAEAVDIARSNVPDAKFHEADALAIPFDSDSFDAVVCGFGIIHVPDPEAARPDERDPRAPYRPGRGASAAFCASAMRDAAIRRRSVDRVRRPSRVPPARTSTHPRR